MEEKKNKLKQSRENIENLKFGINSMLSEMTFDVSDLYPQSDALPGLNIEVEHHNYEDDIKKIKTEAIETLNCLSSLYLDEDNMKKKNISNLIKNDAIAISDIKFSLECAKRGLINCMKQLDAGVNDPEMHVAVNTYQKEIRESNKMVYDLLNKMKIFYRELKEELKSSQINVEDETIQQQNQKPERQSMIIDSKTLNDLIEKNMSSIK